MVDDIVIDKWIRFIRVWRQRVKTKVFMVNPKNSDYELGEIRWYSPWRHYCFFPTMRFETVHSDRCLLSISQFLTALNLEHRKILGERK